jgi:hypothetical protein
MWNNIHPVTLFLSITSLFMNFSTTIIINLALDNNPIEGFLLIKALSKASGYIGKFLVGWISEIFKCNKLILKIGYGSIFVIKPMFYISMMSLLPQIEYNLYLLVLADCLDQFTNNFRDISRDAMIAKIIKNNHLSKNLFFRKASSIAGTMIGAIVAFGISLLYPVIRQSYNILELIDNPKLIIELILSPRSLVLLFAIMTAFIGYKFLKKALMYEEENTQIVTKFTWKDILDMRLWSLLSITVFLASSIIFKFSVITISIIVATLAIIYIFVSIKYYKHYNRKPNEYEIKEENENEINTKIEYKHINEDNGLFSNRLYLFENRTFVFVGILSTFLFIFGVNHFSLIDVFQSMAKNNTNVFALSQKPWKQAMLILYYLISFSASSVLSIFNMKKISNIMIIYLASFITIGLVVMTKTLWGFAVALIAYGIINGTFEPAINAYVIRHTQKFSYKGITLGLFSIFNSIGVIMGIIIIKSIVDKNLYGGDIYDVYKFSLIGNIFISIILVILSIFNKNKLKEI